MKIIVVVQTAIVALGIVFAPVAHADDEQGYLDEVGQIGFPGMNPGGALLIGHMMCDNLHHGMSPDQAAGSFGLWSGILGPRIVHAAQHHLCPDTLGPGA